MSTWHGVMTDREKLMQWKISTNTVCGYKTDTKCAHSVRGRPTLKDEGRFRNGLVRKPYERSLYERTFMSEPFIEKHAISTELWNANREKHNLKSHRVCKRDREPSRIPIRSLKSLRNKSRKVREFVYARILSCFPIYAASGSHAFALSNSLLCNIICQMSRNAERNIKPERTQICV